MGWSNDRENAILAAYDRWYLTPVDWDDEDEDEEEEEEEPLEQMWGESDEEFKHRCWQDYRYEVPDDEWDEYMEWFTAQQKRRKA